MLMPEQKKTTALGSSVAADEEQSSGKNTIKSIAESESEINEPRSFAERMRRRRKTLDPAYLHTVTMSELYDTVYSLRPSVVDGLLSAGVYILAGAPKTGKSFLVAQIAYHVSTGTPLWNYEVQEGTVLYLALEDDFQRIQKRMYRMFGTNSTDKLVFAVAAKQLGSGLNEQLQKFVREHPNTRLIIIDTLQKIREAQGDKYSYANDYEIMGRLKQFADQNMICILVVHHTRKQQAEDTQRQIPSALSWRMEVSFRYIWNCKRPTAHRISGFCWRPPRTKKRTFCSAMSLTQKALAKKVSM